MDESWRTTIGPPLPRRGSSTCGGGAAAAFALDPDDFRDVFGGPPRTLLRRRFSAEIQTPPAASLYEEVFCSVPVPVADGCVGRRMLPEFRIPTREVGMVRREEGFFDDIFGSDSGEGESKGCWMRRSRSRSKSKSKSKSKSSASSEEVSKRTMRVFAEEEDDDAVLSAFASRLRPINIPTRRREPSPPSTISGGDESSIRCFGIPCSPSSCLVDFKDSDNSSYTTNGSSTLYKHQPNIGFCRSSSAMRIRLESSFSQYLRRPPWSGNSEADSPSSVTSSVFTDPKMALMRVNREEDEEGEEKYTAESSFVIEIDGHGRRKVATEESAALEEAIAWAKEKFWSQMYKKDESSC
ncbi:uncharacterized protein [Typha angustifolia]|uniref:uncharacterized protein n=1 Tax=Typha angustifolia TaxID=59011 RepID=UPI003C2DDA6B